MQVEKIFTAKDAHGRKVKKGLTKRVVKFLSDENVQ